MPEFEAIVAIAMARWASPYRDNTLPSPYLLETPALSANIVVHSATAPWRPRHLRGGVM
ncbi:MAG: hypothetical protein IPO28_14985 [Holophagaceae bacterium]|nr:hypothetical protein [Holophagaceae bacterium]